jgi:jumonji domain-containing protein 7
MSSATAALETVYERSRYLNDPPTADSGSEASNTNTADSESNDPRETVRLVLSKVTKDYWVGHEVDVLEQPSALDFMRQAVCCYRPVILRGLMRDWPAMQRWNMDYLEEKMNGVPITVNLTPDGLADAVKSVVLPTEEDEDIEKQVFTYPYERSMSFAAFQGLMSDPREDDAVAYLSEQNDNLRQKFPSIVNDVPVFLPIAAEAFSNCATEAINLWIGDERSVTSLHKDHFEVLLCMFNGFTIS